MTKIIFDTSGTTGAPKQVIYNEAALLAMAETDKAELGLTSRSVISLDRWGLGGWRKVYDARVSGARLAIYPGHEKRSMREWINQEQITYLSLLATTFRWLAQGLHKFPSVEILEIGGEMVDWGDVDLARIVCPNAAFLNRYGCSETNIICRKHVGYGETGEGRMPVGKPVKGVEIYAGTPATPTEISVRSPYSFDGYYNAEALTAAKFRDGWYYTGDLGYWLPNGELMHCGRRDFTQKMSEPPRTVTSRDDRLAKWTLAGG